MYVMGVLTSGQMSVCVSRCRLLAVGGDCCVSVSVWCLRGGCFICLIPHVSALVSASALIQMQDSRACA